MNSPVGRSLQDQNSLQTIVQKLIDEAVRQGADQAEAAANHDIGISATARLGDVENLEYTNDRGVGVTVYVDSRKGNASTSDFSDNALVEALVALSNSPLQVEAENLLRDASLAMSGFVGSMPGALRPRRLDAR